MPKAKPWLKMWAEWIDDPKMDNLTLAEQAAWWRLTTLAHKCVAEGALTAGGQPMSMEAIMKTLKISEEADRATFKSMVEKMTASKSLHIESGTLVVTHYKDRQKMVPSETKEATRDRQRAWRAAHKPPSQKGRDRVPPLESSKGTPPSSKDTEEEEETEEEQNSLVTAMSRQESCDKLMAEISRLYSSELRDEVTESVADELRDFVENYTGELDWIGQAFREAVTRGHRKWPYIRKILENWQETGGPDGRAGEELNRRREIKARQRGPITGWTEPPSADEYRRSGNI